MDLYEVHVPCGQKVVVVCKENGEDVKILKNGKPIYKENEENTKDTEKTTSNIPPTLETKKADDEPSAKKEDSKETPDVAEEDSESTVEKPNMAGGRKSRRNNARKNNATRKNQAGGKKRGPNGYMRFANKMRPQILKEHPELKSDVVGVARKIGEKWRSLSATEKAKY